MAKEYIDSNTQDNLGEKYLELIRKKTLWEEYTYTYKNESIKVEIPLKNNIRYTNIENFGDHNLSNNLALEMIIRNKEFQNYIYYSQIVDFEFEDKSEELKENHLRKLQRELVEKFGFNIKDVLKLITHHPYINEQINDYLDNVANESLILNPPFINDFKDGLKKVLDFYLKKEQLFILIPADYEKIDISNIENIKKSKEKIYVKILDKSNYKYDYIMLSVFEDLDEKCYRVDNSFYRLPPPTIQSITNISDEYINNNLSFICIPIKTFNKEKLVSLAEKYFPIEFLHEELKISFTEDDLIDYSIKDSKYIPILPSLKFKSSKTIDISLNIDVFPEELTEKIKLLYDNKNIKSFIEIFNKDIETTLKVKNIKYIGKTKTVRNRDYSNAFLIYDLYYIIGKEFNKKIVELEQKAEYDINKIKISMKYDTKIRRDHEINKINLDLEKKKKLFNKTRLDNQIKEITNIEISKLRGLHSLMQEYIDELKFKNIILDK